MLGLGKIPILPSPNQLTAICPLACDKVSFLLDSQTDEQIDKPQPI